MKRTVAVAGNSGPKVRSDCEIFLEIKTQGNIIIDLTSKVKALYGDSINNLITEVLDFLELNMLK